MSDPSIVLQNLIDDLAAVRAHAMRHLTEQEFAVLCDPQRVLYYLQAMTRCDPVFAEVMAPCVEEITQRHATKTSRP